MASIRDCALAASYDPTMGGQHVTTAFLDMRSNEASVFQSLLKPDDSYDVNGVYWGETSIGQRIKFVRKVDTAEAKREFGSIWSMIKKEPLSPLKYYFRHMIIPGAGLLLEGYVLFSIGNIKPLLQATFPSCWSTNMTCDSTWVQAVDYLEICGIIVGQVLVGVIGDWLGRRWGLIQDATIMFVGLLMLTAAWGVTQNGWVICYAWVLFFYSIGVGGEYPMTAMSGMENAVGSGKVSTKDDRLHRGRNVTSAFLMQGMRSAFKQLARAKKKASVTGYDTKSLKLTFTHFGPRLLATAGAWYANDVFFYGNKLFQSEFVSVLLPGNESVVVGWLYNLLGVGVSLVGYYLASLLIDNKLYGRKWMMIVGFLLDFILFVVPAFNYYHYSHVSAVKAFQAMYFLSSFFNQFGPNSVTFIAAAEVFPTPIRATAHGFSAAVGKLGALTAAILYNYIDTQTKFYIVPWFGLVGALLTWLFLPDTTGLDLKEQERRWTFIRDGRENEYCGVAIHPRHLSLWERWRGVGKNYNAERDYEQRVEEMRCEWELS
ncbi:hypothetical protein LTR66_002273 [Elasticomyces elasticus]|nr:hypothetical protein LTR66_002273 [Elasticomyces elasticus]